MIMYGINAAVPPPIYKLKKKMAFPNEQRHRVVLLGNKVYITVLSEANDCSIVEIIRKDIPDFNVGDTFVYDNLDECIHRWQDNPVPFWALMGCECQGDPPPKKTQMPVVSDDNMTRPFIDLTYRTIYQGGHENVHMDVFLSRNFFPEFINLIDIHRCRVDDQDEFVAWLKRGATNGMEKYFITSIAF